MPAYINQARRICTSVAHTLPSERRLYLGKLEVMGKEETPRGIKHFDSHKHSLTVGWLTLCRRDQEDKLPFH